MSRQAARIGSAAFLLPDGVKVPVNGTPPLITNCSIGYVYTVKYSAIDRDGTVGFHIIVHVT